LPENVLSVIIHPRSIGGEAPALDEVLGESGPSEQAGSRRIRGGDEGALSLPSPFATENTEFSMVVPAHDRDADVAIEAIDGVVAAVSSCRRS
jgi:hypothetical protein